MKNKWITTSGGKYFVALDKQAEVDADVVAAQLRGNLEKLDSATLTALKKRQMVKVQLRLARPSCTSVITPSLF